MHSDKRRHVRYEIDLEGHIETSGGTIACAIRDVSVEGARLALDDASAVPDEFILVLNDNLRRRCVIAWRSGEQVGVRFLASTPQLVSYDAPETGLPQASPWATSILQGDTSREVRVHTVLLPAKAEGRFPSHGGDRWLMVETGEIVFTAAGQPPQRLAAGQALLIQPSISFSLRNPSEIRSARTVEVAIVER